MEIIFLAYIAVLGLFIGSFLNVLSDRLPRGEDVISTRSHCEKCRKTLRWWELVPVLSYLFLRGRCARCRTPLSPRYPVTELLSAVMLTVVWIYAGGNIAVFALSSIVASCLFVIFFSDLVYEIIPDSMIVIGSVAALVLRLVTPAGGDVILAVLSGLFSSLFFYFLYFITRGRGMGFGDVKLVFLLGLAAGFPGSVIGLYAAFLTGAAVGVILVLVRKKSLKSHIPFGPFLIAGTVFAILFGHRVLSWWKGVI